jgi:predicted alpha/beta hydrolase
MQEITIPTQDGFDLPATLFESNGGYPSSGPVVLISSATGAPRRFYRHFAQYLADNGARAVLTYDYRGVGAPLPAGLRRKVRMAQWGTVDLPAAARLLRNRFPGHALVGLGHSFGGQALGISGAADSFSRYMTLSAGSGYLEFTREAAKLKRNMNFLCLPLSMALGQLPRWAGFGEPLPHGAFNQWRRWCNSPDYFHSDPEVPETERFGEVSIPMVAVGFEDDPWATRQSVEALVSWYSNAPIKLRWFSEQEAGAPVGHFGFFRKDHAGSLWPQLADWLVRD